MSIPVLGKFESKTKNGKIVDYSAVDGAPIVEADLTATTLTANTYYKHTGTKGTYTTGVIYYYNGSSLKPIDGSGYTSPESNTDTKVTQTKTTSASSMPLLLAPAGQTETTTTTANFTNNIYAVPSTGRLYVTGSSNPLFGIQAKNGTAFFLQAQADKLFLGPTSTKALAFTGSTGAISMPNNLTVTGTISEGGKTLANKYLGVSAVSVTQKLASGTEIGSVTVNGTETKLYAPPSGLGSQEVENIVDGRLEYYVQTQALEEGLVDLSEYGFAKSDKVEQLSNIVQDLDQITIPEIENQMVKTVKVGGTAYTPTNGVVSLPAYPTGTGGGNVIGGTKTISITLSPSDWVDKAQTVSVSDVTADSKVVVSPEGNPRPFSEAGIYCSESGDGTLTFVCETVPTREINVSVFVVSPTQISSAVRVTLLADNWNGTIQEVSVEGLTRNNSVVVSPYGNPRNYANSWIYCSVQLEGKLTFNCEVRPTMDIEVNVLIL
jgi:hypothetical protein